MGNRMVEHRPANGAEGVPWDARLTLAFERDGCSSSAVVVQVDSDQDESWDLDVTLDSSTELAHWLPSDGWTPGTTYTVTVFDDTSDDTDELGRSFSFTAGDAQVEAILEAPSVTLYDAWGDPGSGGLGVVEVDLHVSHQPDVLGLGLVQVVWTSEPGTALATKFATGTGELEVALTMIASTDLEQVCLAARQMDATGEATALGDEACIDIAWDEVDDAGCGGCNSGVGVMGAGLVWCVVACLIAVRREESE